MTTTVSNDVKDLADRLAAGAIALAQLGWLVLPLHSLRTSAEDDGRFSCTCGNDACTSPGKHTVSPFKAALERATADVDTVTRWWKDRSKPRNVGVRTGKASGIFVVDVDAGGTAGVAELERRFGPLPETLEAVSGTGGRHLYFAYPAGVVVPTTREQLAPRVNTIGEGDYVVAPPSLHRTGSSYTWVQRPVVPAPDWLVRLVAPSPVAPAAERPAADLLSSGDETAARPLLAESTWKGSPYAAATGRVTGENVAPALEALARVLAREELDPDAVIEATVRANTLHCTPPLSRAEAERLAHFALAADHERRVVANASPRAKKIDPATIEGQEIAARERRTERAAGGRAPHISALKAWTSVWFQVVDFDEHRAELRLKWTETSADISLPVFGTPAEVERALLRYTGSLETFAGRAHEKANGRQFLRVLKDLARVAPPRKREDADAAPIQLVRAILALKVWIQTRDDRGETKRFPKMLSSAEGFFADEGVGIVRDRSTQQRLLIVSVPALANGAFARNAEFRGSTGRELVELLRQAPGYAGVRRPREARRVIDTDFHAIDLDQFTAVVGRVVGPVADLDFDESFPRSPTAENPELFPTEAADSVGEPLFPQPSPSSPTGDDDDRWLGERGNDGGTTLPPQNPAFSSEIDEVFYGRGNGGTNSSLS
jgi:hypothetical protein